MMTWILLLSLWLGLAQGMRTEQIRELRYVAIDLLCPGFLATVTSDFVSYLTTRSLERKPNIYSTTDTTII